MEVLIHGNAVVVDVDDSIWVKYMEAKLDSKSKRCPPAHPFTICEVPRDIREIDSVAHDPLVVSIGPYHRGKRSLLDMEQVKWRNLDAFRGRAGESFINYLKTMKEIEPRAQDCYSGKTNMEADEFIEMMLLDGLFIIEFFSTSGDFLLSLLLQHFSIDEGVLIDTISGMFCRVGRDMLLLENQLPLFVLERLWSLTDYGSRFDLWHCAYTILLSISLPFKHEDGKDRLLQEIFVKDEKRRENPEMINKEVVHHLLHLFYLLLKPTSLPRYYFPSSGQESQSMECTAKLPAIIKKILPFLSPSKADDEQPPPLNVIPSAVELEEAGVVFKCVGARSFLDVKFEHGTLNMPRLSVHDSTKSFLRNSIAYEQCFPNQGSHITSYCSFMDQLVSTPRDVEILKKSKIIENWLGSDEEVAHLFNDLCKGIFALDLNDSYLADSSEQIREYTQKTWPKWRAKLKHDYCSSPWAIISFIAATFVILLTLAQTYAAFT